MGMSGDTALVMAKNYVKKTLQGQGALKGQDGFSPIIEENADNTDKVYKLDITTADSAFTTPNLRGKDGECSGGGEANVIESISVNGTPISVDENKNVDITVPSIDGLAKTEDIPTKVSELTDSADYAKKTDLHSHTNKTVLDGITSDKVTAWDTVNNKVDKVDGKGLSTEDYTTSDKTIVSKLGESAEGSLTYNGSEIKPSVATTESTGVVKPDGKSMSVDESGTLSINLDGTTITLDEAKNVIKLADTLKDKIGTALQPESIVSNQTTTVEGFALDARQANPNIDGSLAKQISDLNGSLSNENVIPINIDGVPYNNLNFYVIRGGYCYLSLYLSSINNTDPIYIYGVPEPILSLNFPLIHFHYGAEDNKIALASVFNSSDGGKDQPYVRITPKEVSGLCGQVVYPIAFN